MSISQDPKALTASEAEIAVKEYIAQQGEKSLLRFITCGSVDDGKSTLIGRLLYESKLLFEDQISALKSDSARSGTQGDDIDFALLVDGLASEREQGITIDVAYRFFSTEARKFIVIDTPGHEQYTRNMATGASQAELAVLLVDARAGLATQTRRHSFIVKNLGVKKVVLAINKMDLVGYSEERYQEIVTEYKAFAAQIGIEAYYPIPMSALKGDNVVEPGTNMPWYDGQTLIEYLNTVPTSASLNDAPFRMHVQWVNRPHLDFRGFSGRIASGVVRPGDRIKVMPSGHESCVSEIHTMDGALDVGLPQESVTIRLDDEIDVSRGDTLCEAAAPVDVGDKFNVRLLWMSDELMRPGQTYIMKLGAQMVNATVSKPKYVIDVNTLAQEEADSLQLNEIGDCILNSDKPITFETYDDNEEMGGFILINRHTNATIAMGFIQSALSTTDMHLRTQEFSINPDLRAGQKNQKAITLWFTGLKRSGKTFISNALEQRLFARGNHAFIMDPENIWKGISEDLDYTGADRNENLRRVAHVSKLMNDAGLITMICFASPYESERSRARNIIGEDNILEIYVNTPLEMCEAKDMEGYYARARRGELKNVAGIDITYEPPHNPDVTVGLQTHSIEQAANEILQALIKKGCVAQS